MMIIAESQMAPTAFRRETDLTKMVQLSRCSLKLPSWISKQCPMVEAARCQALFS